MPDLGTDLRERLVSHGKWSPNWMLAATVPRGVADAGEVRAALEVLGRDRVGCALCAQRLRPHTTASTRNAVPQSLRSLLTRLRLLPQELAAWVG